MRAGSLPEFKRSWRGCNSRRDVDAVAASEPVRAGRRTMHVPIDVRDSFCAADDAIPKPSPVVIRLGVETRNRAKPSRSGTRC